MMIDDDEDEERRDEESKGERRRVGEQRCIGSVMRSVRTPFCAKFLRNVAEERFEDTGRDRERKKERERREKERATVGHVKNSERE